MKIISFVLTGIVLVFVPVVFAQQDITQAPPPAQTTTPTAPMPPVTMALPESTDPLQLSIQGGGLWSVRDDSRLHDGEEIIGRLTYDVTPNVALGGESGGLRVKDELDGTTYGHFDGVPILGDLVFKLPIPATGNRLVPYVYESAGIIFWSYDKSGYSDDSGVVGRTRAHFASKPGAGLEFYLTPHVALFVEASYLFSERFHLKGATTTPPNGKVDVDSLYGGGGIKIAF